MKIVKLNDHVGVSAQIAAGDLAAIAASGYTVLVNNRPDGEEAGQPDSAAMADAANAAGLEYHHMPVTAGSFPGARFEQVADLFDDPSRPVLAFCRTGTRSTNLWVASREPSARQSARTQALQLGYELVMAAKYAEAHPDA